MKFTVSAALIWFWAGCAAAQTVAIADCPVLRAWGATAGPDARWNDAVVLPAPFAADATMATFGAPFEDWTHAGAREVDGALNQCSRTAAREKDNALKAEFDALRRALTAPTRLLRDAETARETVARSLAAIEGAAPDARLAADLIAMAAAPESEARALRVASRDLAQIGRSIAALPAAEIVVLRGRLTTLADAMGSGVLEGRLAEVAAAPETLEGVLVVRRIAMAATAEMGPAAAPVRKAADAREAAIAAALSAADPTPIRLPTCPDAITWTSALRAGDSRATRAGRVLTALETPELEQLFGKPFAGWSDADLGALGALGQHCRAEARAGLLGADTRAAERQVQALVEIHARAGNQPAIFAALAESGSRARTLLAQIEAAPHGVDGLDAVAAARRDAARLEPEDAARVEAAAILRRADLVQAHMAATRDAFAATPDSFDGLQDIGRLGTEALMGPMIRHLSQEERLAVRDVAIARAEAIAPTALAGFTGALEQASADRDGLDTLQRIADETIFGDGPVWSGYRQALAARRDAIVAVLVQSDMPAFDADMAALPVTREGLAKALQAKLHFDEMVSGESAAYAPMAERAAARTRALQASLAQARCAGPVAAARLSSSQAAQPVLVGAGTATLADMLCALAENAPEPPRYAGPGFFGSEHRIEFIGPEGFLIKLILQEAEVRPGVKALVGKRIEDPAQGRDISASEWGQFIGLATDLADAPACAEVADSFDGASWAWERLLDCLIVFPDTPLPKG